MKERICKYDNIKAIAIVLVVFLHIITISKNHLELKSLFLIISNPAFIFLAGYFASFDKKKILKLFLLYIVFQYLYMSYYIAVLNPTAVMQFTTPYQHMWFIWALVVYLVLIPFLHTDDIKNQFVIVGTFALVSLWAGYDEKIVKYMSISRVLTFLPFFLVGYYLKINKKDISMKFLSQKKRGIFIAMFLILAILSGVYIYSRHIIPEVAYFCYPYEMTQSSMGVRAMLLIFAVGWIFLMLLIVPNKHIPLITTMGQLTLPIYLVHYFVSMYLKSILYEKRLELTVTGVIWVAVGTILVLTVLAYLGRLLLESIKKRYKKTVSLTD